MAGIPLMIKTDVVNSEISLLLGKNTLKEAKIKLDLENDKTTIFRKDVILDNATCATIVFHLMRLSFQHLIA